MPIAASTRPRIRIAGEPSQQRGFTSKAADVFSFILGFATLFSIHFVGDLYVAEILLVVIFPILLIMKGRRALRRELKFVYILMGVWLAGLVLADAYNHIPLTDRMRGMALIVFFAINLLSMSIVLGQNEKRKVLYLVGLMIGALVSIKLQPSEATAAYPWKFGYAWGTMQLVMLVSSYFYSKQRYLLSALLVVGICGVNAIMNFRSPILQLLITVALVYPFIPEQLGAIQILPQSQGLRIAVLAIFALGAAAVADEVVKFVTTAGYIGEDAQAKNEAQAKAGNLLLGGRPEFVIGLQAALDRPIIGHGSWAKDLKYFEMLYDRMVEAGVQPEQSGGDIAEEADGLIPAHSHIITAWVWAGIAGLIFWLYILWFVFKGISRIALSRPPLAPVYTWFLISMVWDIFFSPFAANRRMVEAMMLVVIADQLRGVINVPTLSWRRLGAANRVRPLRLS
jgi:hypothetical protein